MDRIEIERRVPPDGILQRTLPLGADQADRVVKIVVEPVGPERAMRREEWPAWVQSMAGSLQGDFQRPLQGEYEVREPL